MKTTTMLRSTALLAGAMLLSTSAMAVSLADAVVKRTETIRYSPGEATTPAGAATLYQKLQLAADRVCKDAADTLAFEVSDAYTSCVTDALARAVSDLGIPSVSRLHMQETPASRMVALSRQ